MVVANIVFQSPEYQLALDLRNRLLRVPLGLDVFREDLTPERDQWHYGMFDQGQLVGCVVAAPLDAELVKIRQMAIDTPWQGRGLGRQLLTAVEQFLSGRGVAFAMLHARIEAEGFYHKLGYRRGGDEFVEVGIPHVTMQKRLE